MRTTTSRSNLSQIASSATGTSPQGTTARKSTESVRSQRSVGIDRSSPSPATMNRTLPTSSTTSAAQTNQTQTSSSSTASQPLPAQAQPQPQPQAQPSGGGGWGWSSVWSTASTAINQASQLAQQARTVAEEQVRTNAGGLGEGLMKAWNHEDNNQNGTGTEGVGAGVGGPSGGMKKWTEGVQGLVKNANLEGLGTLSCFLSLPQK